MNEADIRKYANLMNELGLTGLEFRERNQFIRLERTPVQVGAAPVTVTVPAEAAPVERHEQPDDGLVAVKSPMVGTFYAAPGENADPFVKVGDRVKQGDVLCIIEAMKLMNEITAEQDGIIREILAVNSQAVDYGTVLFRMEV